MIKNLLISFKILIGAFLICVILWFVGLWLLLDPPFKGKRTLSKLKWIPEQTTNLFIKDTHGGLHGDGITYLYFECSSPNALKIIESRTWRGSSPWKNGPIREDVINSFTQLAQKFSAPEAAIPPFSESSIRYQTYPKEKPKWHYKEIMVVDEANGKIWYISIQT